MQSDARSKIPLKLASLTMALIPLGMTGCFATKHVAQGTGQTGIHLGSGKTAFPNAKGELEVGKYDLAPGDMIRRPKSEQEVIETLKAAGATFQEKK